MRARAVPKRASNHLAARANAVASNGRRPPPIFDAGQRRPPIDARSSEADAANLSREAGNVLADADTEMATCAAEVSDGSTCGCSPAVILWRRPLVCHSLDACDAMTDLVVRNNGDALVFQEPDPVDWSGSYAVTPYDTVGNPREYSILGGFGAGPSVGGVEANLRVAAGPQGVAVAENYIGQTEATFGDMFLYSPPDFIQLSGSFTWFDKNGIAEDVALDARGAVLLAITQGFETSRHAVLVKEGPRLALRERKQ